MRGIMWRGVEDTRRLLTQAGAADLPGDGTNALMSSLMKPPWVKTCTVKMQARAGDKCRKEA